MSKIRNNWSERSASLRYLDYDYLHLLQINLILFLDFLILLIGCYCLHRQTEKYIHTDTCVCLHMHTNRWSISHQDRQVHKVSLVNNNINQIWIFVEYFRDMIWFWIGWDEVSCQPYTFLDSWSLPFSTDFEWKYAMIISSSNSTLLLLDFGLEFTFDTTHVRSKMLVVIWF